MLTLSERAALNRRRLTVPVIEDQELEVLLDVYLQGQYTYQQLADMATMPKITLWRKLNNLYNASNAE